MNRRMTMEHNTTASRSGEWASRWAEDACAKATRAAVGAAEVEGRGDLGLASGAARGDAGRRDETRRKRVVVTVDGLGAAYGDDIIFEDFSYEIAHNDRIAVVGANGAGKSTLVRAVVAAAAREGKLIGCTDAERNALVEHDEDETIALATVTVGYYAQTPLDAHDETSPMDYAVDVVSRRPDAARAQTKARQPKQPP